MANNNTYINPNCPVYISCAGEDQEIVKSFNSKLDDYGIFHKDYISIEDINEIPEFEKEFETCKIVVIFYSLDYFKSAHCMYEYSLIRNNKSIKVFTVKCQDFKFTNKNKKKITDHWADICKENQEKDYEILTWEIQKACDNLYYLDKGKSCSIYNLHKFFGKHKYWEIDALPKELTRFVISEEKRILEEEKRILEEENRISKTKYLKRALIAMAIVMAAIFIIFKVISYVSFDGKTDEPGSEQDTQNSQKQNINNSSSSSAKNTHYNMPDLNNPIERQKLEQTAKNQVEYFVNCLDRITDKNVNIDKRRRKIKDALELFIGEGYSFKLDDIEQEAVKIEITSTTKGDTTYYVRHYLHNLCNIADKYYTDVSIKAVDVLKCTDIQPYNDTLYVCTVSFTQKFLARRGEAIQYADYTRKHVKVFLMPGYDNEGYGIVAKLGDVSASETEKIY